MFSPDRDAFHKAVNKGANLIPLAQSWPADLETPLTTWIKVGDGTPPGVLLESVEGGETLGRWSVIACDPLWTASARGSTLQRVWRDGSLEITEGNPFDLLRECLQPYNCVNLQGLPRLDSCTASGAMNSFIGSRAPYPSIPGMTVPRRMGSGC